MAESTGGSDDAPERFVARVRELYERESMSQRRIAEQLGVRRSDVDRALRSAGVVIPPRGAGRRRPTQRHADPDDLADQLRELYAVERLTRQQASDKLGLSEGLVRSRLTEFGIPTRTRGRSNREDRVEVPPEQVVALYRYGGLSAQRAADLLGVSRKVFLRTAHDRAIPVRPGAATQRDSDPITLIAALYDDRHVRTVLARHDVPIVNRAGPIWQRFPRPVTLTAALCRELYLDAGLSTTQIELVTGQPAGRVAATLRAAGVTLRPPGGRSPFRIRWEATHPRR